MAKELLYMAERLKSLRNKRGITQSEMAKSFGLTRSCINAWEMGISVPSTQYIVELSKYFGVSSDYILGMKTGSAINIDGLSEKDAALLCELVQSMKKIRSNTDTGC